MSNTVRAEEKSVSSAQLVSESVLHCYTKAVYLLHVITTYPPKHTINI
jgi:hypothetical protein